MVSISGTRPRAQRTPGELSFVATPDNRDGNGHLNVRYYFDWHVQALEDLFGELGVDDNYLRTECCGIFALEHHMFFLAEVLIGDEVQVRVTVTECTDKIVSGTTWLYNRTRARLAGRVAFKAGHVSLETRRIVPWPERLTESLAARIDADREAHEAKGVPPN